MNLINKMYLENHYPPTNLVTKLGYKGRLTRSVGLRLQFLVHPVVIKVGGGVLKFNHTFDFALPARKFI